MKRWLALLAVLLAIPIVAMATGSLTIPQTIFTQPGGTNVAPLLDTNYQAIATYVNNREITFGLLAARPVAGTAGRYYFATDTLILYADTGAAWTQLAPGVNAALVASMSGLELANNGSSTASITIGTGAATSDDTSLSNRVLINNTASFIKKPGTAWAVGSNQGCLDTGAPAAFTWYHVFIIERVDTGVVDALCSTSATAPTMPTNYTKKRRIGSIRSTWFATPGAEYYFFSQVGDRFIWATKTSTLDVSTAAAGVIAVTATVSAPNGVSTLALLNVNFTTGYLYVSELAAADEAPSATAAPLSSVGDGGAAQAGQVSVMTDTASSIRYRPSANNALRIVTYGWIDRRGQQ